MRSYVGLDVHSKTIFFVAMNLRGKVIAEGSVPTSPERLQQMRQVLCQGTRSFTKLVDVIFYDPVSWVYGVSCPCMIPYVPGNLGGCPQ